MTKTSAHQQALEAELKHVKEMRETAAATRADINEEIARLDRTIATLERTLENGSRLQKAGARKTGEAE